MFSWCYADVQCFCRYRSWGGPPVKLGWSTCEAGVAHLCEAGVAHLWSWGGPPVKLDLNRTTFSNLVQLWLGWLVFCFFFIVSTVSSTRRGNNYHWHLADRLLCCFRYSVTGTLDINTPWSTHPGLPCGV